jgi:hypothetical protein
MAAVGCGVRRQGSASCLKPVPSGEAKPLGSLRLTPSALTFPSFRQLTTDNGPRTTDNQLHAPCSLPYALLAFNQPHQSNQFNQLNQPNQSNQSVLGPLPSASPASNLEPKTAQRYALRPCPLPAASCPLAPAFSAAVAAEALTRTALRGSLLINQSP